MSENPEINLDKLINEVLAGYRSIVTPVEWAPVIICRGLTGLEKIRAELEYDKGLAEAVALDIPPRKELEKELLLRGLWTPAQENLIRQAEHNVKILTSQLPSLQYKKSRLNALKKKIDRAKKTLGDLESKKHALMGACAERHATEQKTWWTIYRVACDTDFNPIWKSYEDYLSCDREDISSIIHCYLDQYVLSREETRQIARSALWRVYFSSCKNSRDLFGKNLSDLDPNQLNVLYWSIIYDNAYGAYEPPDDSVIENDEAFDAWLDAKSAERKKETKRNSLTKNKNIRAGKNFVSEEFIMTDSEGAKELYSANLNEEFD